MKAAAQKIYVLAAAILLALSFFTLVYHYRYTIATVCAPVYINIEIKREYSNDVSLLTYPDGKIHLLLPSNTTASAFVAVYAEVSGGRLLEDIYLSVPETGAETIIAAIDSISAAVGNEIYYLSADTISRLEGVKSDGRLLYHISGNYIYKGSIVKKWINWYGDLNFLLRALFAPLMYPLKFWILYLPGFFLLFVLFRNRESGGQDVLKAGTEAWLKKHEAIIFSLIVILGLLFRINGYLQISSSFDELYSAVIASNPRHPFMGVFDDPRNPPLYFMILRLWFDVFGWFEASGKMLSVLIGSCAIISLYMLLRKFAGVKPAIIGGFLMALSKYAVAYSHNMRTYILEMFLVPLVILFFLNTLDKPDKRSRIIYIISGICIVNAHYYGVLLITANFLFYLAYTVAKKTFRWKGFLLFLLDNIIIAASLIPFFTVTALNKALLDKDFNSWIDKPDVGETIFILLGIPLFACAYMAVRYFLRKKKCITERRLLLADNAVFTASLIFIQAFVISLYRPIFSWRYVSICFPLLLIGASLFVTLHFPNKLLNLARFGAFFLLILFLYHEAPAADIGDIYRESQAYINFDAASHPYNRNALLMKKNNNAEDCAYFYGYTPIPLLEGIQKDDIDVLYVNLQHWDENDAYAEIESLGFSTGELVKIRISDSDVVLKLYIAGN
ncbi:MAG: glycosyltransferase family 39 protein [Spirochaetaceae bacterium]|jgi:hypothetical protein|nr:glycosyltransferase family 39 protein [Spirochaetaceae bacterium]